VRHDWLRRLAASLPPGDEDAIKELLRMMRGTVVEKSSFYSIMAAATGLTHDELSALDRDENRRRT